MNSISKIITLNMVKVVKFCLYWTIKCDFFLFIFETRKEVYVNLHLLPIFLSFAVYTIQKYILYCPLLLSNSACLSPQVAISIKYAYNSHGRFWSNNDFHFTCLANHSSKIRWDSSAACTAIASSMLYLIVQPCETSGNNFT